MIAVISILLGGCNGGDVPLVDNSAVPPVPISTTKQYFGDRESHVDGVYKGALDHLVDRDAMNVIARHTIRPSAKVVETLTMVAYEIREDLVSINRQPSKLTDNFDVYAQFRVIEVKSTPTESIELVRKRFPKASTLIYLSRAGLNSTADVQIVYFERYKLDGQVLKGFCVHRNGEGVEFYDVNGALAEF